MTDVAPLLVVVALVAAASLAWRRRSGLARPHDDSFTAADMAAVGVERNRAAFVLFTAPGCSTCGPARNAVNDVAARHDVAVSVVDAARDEALAASHGVLRVPTTFVVLPGGHVAGRVTGVPRASELVGLLGDVVSQEADAAA